MFRNEIILKEEIRCIVESKASLPSYVLDLAKPSIMFSFYLGYTAKASCTPAQLLGLFLYETFHCSRYFPLLYSSMRLSTALFLYDTLNDSIPLLFLFDFPSITLRYACPALLLIDRLTDALSVPFQSSFFGLAFSQLISQRRATFQSAGVRVDLRGIFPVPGI